MLTLKAKTIFILGVHNPYPMSRDLLTYDSNKMTQKRILCVILKDLMFLDLNLHPKSNLLCYKSDLLCIFANSGLLI